ncbi:complex I 51 kDa subunit family protein [Pseudochelatococcus contaminans]|uniref:NADH-quinone oxidoreductase subunit F n=1 Tax=Pseudochelatococcus contaminans TaxID=1538103 RepID=A0A7W5Z322_9HYPH|nr:NADH-ubiquinone oxidoreductase-F iron-sulfur binding region domain-containing protein [Pseudochelatococcus contaminans]MBB3809200.1 NADH-quinone oxidoreductase subunit F [Pseudochelatococcus contaminans]
MTRLNSVLLNPRIGVGADLAAWRKAGGGEGLARALERPEDIIPTLRAADLRGMGGAGFPTWRKWTATADAPGDEKYVVCNGNEDEPGTFKDCYLLHRTPHQVIEGALIAAAAVRAATVVFYINPHQTDGIEAMRRAVAQWAGDSQIAALERLIGQPMRLTVTPSSGRYIGGEESAVVRWLNGSFPFPRRKPPFPFEQGVNDKPTLINNTETLSNISHILKNGADWYRDLGIGGASGTKLFSLSGDVLEPGLYELPMGTSLQELIFTHGGGMLGGRAFKAVFTGGPSNTLLTARDLDVALDFDSVRARQSRLGTGAMIVISEGTSVVRKVAEYVEFFANGSCGQCPPCKCGTFQMSRLLDRIATGRGTEADRRALRHLCQILPGSGRCALIDGAVTVVQSSLQTFPEEYAAPASR